MRLIDADALIADCELAQKQADRYDKEFANAFYSGGGEISTEWWCVEDMIENAPTIEPERKKGKWRLADRQDPNDKANGNYLYFCSNCFHADLHAKTQEVPYCWCCGAEMEGET